MLSRDRPRCERRSGPAPAVTSTRAGEEMTGLPSPLVVAQDRHFDERAETWTQRYWTHPSFRARLAVVGAEVDRLTEEIPAAWVLDYGGGTGVFAELAAQRAAHVVCVDRSLPMLQYGRTHRDETARVLADAGFDRPLGDVQRVAGDDRALSHLSGSFDAVLAIAVLEYVEDCVGVIGRLAALLRPGGTLLVTVPEPRSPLRWAQRIVGPLAAATRPPRTRIADQSFAVIRPHGDKVPWRQGAEAAGLREQAAKRIALGEAGLRGRFHPTVLIRLQRNEAIDG